MTGISTVRSRRLPASVSRRPIPSSIVAGDRLDGRDDLVVGHFLGGAEKAGVAAVHEDGPIAFGVAAQGADQLPPFGVVERPEIHGDAPFLSVKSATRLFHKRILAVRNSASQLGED